MFNLAYKQKVTFPCNKWFSKTRDDNEIARDLYPIINSFENVNKSLTKEEEPS